MFNNLAVWIEDIICNIYQLKYFPVKNKTKFALIIPGGGYSFVSCSNEGVPIAKELNNLGYSAFVLRYRTKKKGRYPAPQQDVAKAIRYILDNAEALNVEKEGYSIWGFSAGGHLAASFCTAHMGYKNYNLPKPKMVALAYPVITMGEFTHKDSYNNLFGREGDYVEFGSIEKHVTPNFPKTYVWCCENDDCVPQENTEMMIEELKKNNVPYIGRVIKGVKKGHGIAAGKRTNADGWINEAVTFWSSN